MNHRKTYKVCVVLILGLVILGGADRGFPQDGESKIVDNFIARQATKAEADEYAEARKLLRGDVDRDGKPDLVVLYTLEGFGGGNMYRQYLAVFLAKGATFRFADDNVVGGKLFRDVTLRSITGGKINFDTKEYRKNDAACCPSKSGKTSYVLARAKLKEQK